MYDDSEAKQYSTNGRICPISKTLKQQYSDNSFNIASSPPRIYEFSGQLYMTKKNILTTKFNIN